MIPYIHIDDLQLGPVALHPFGILVATGVVLGTALAKRRARWLGQDQNGLMSFVTWMLVGGFVGGHVLDEIFYHPKEVLEAPWSLLYLWAGLSSFGGFIGALVGVVLWKYFDTRPVTNLGNWFTLVRPVRRAEPLPLLPYCDTILAVFPIAWTFGRLGCTVVHDHPGLATSASMPLAVAYGPGPVVSYGLFELRYGNTPRYDLGLLEMLFALVIGCTFALTWKKKLPIGTYAAVLPLIYAPVRFAMDYLRLEDAEGGDLRYAALTPAQWACIALFGLGLVLLTRLKAPVAIRT
jgi:phosphatidylglycerol---prolipoprotein diacylglyceryl transferase